MDNLIHERWSWSKCFNNGNYVPKSESWRKPRFVIGFGHHYHEIDANNPNRLVVAYSVGNCVFCQADLTFDRTLEEILYHFSQYDWRLKKETHEILMDKWKNNVDAWGDPIGNNIKGE